VLFLLGITREEIEAADGADPDQVDAGPRPLTPPR